MHYNTPPDGRVLLISTIPLANKPTRGDGCTGHAPFHNLRYETWMYRLKVRDGANERKKDGSGVATAMTHHPERSLIRRSFPVGNFDLDGTR